MIESKIREISSRFVLQLDDRKPRPLEASQAKIIIEMCPKGRVRSKYKIAPKEITWKKISQLGCNGDWV